MRIVFFIAVFVIAALSLWGFFNCTYVDTFSRSKAFSDNIVILVILSLLIGALFFIFFLKIFPRGWHNQNVIGKFLMPLVFPILAFVLLRGILLLINSEIGEQHEFTLKGLIWSKKMEKMRKGRRNYYLEISDTTWNKIYKLKVNRKVYESIGKWGDGFSKEFKIGSLGIIYRKEY